MPTTATTSSGQPSPVKLDEEGFLTDAAQWTPKDLALELAGGCIEHLSLTRGPLEGARLRFLRSEYAAMRQASPGLRRDQHLGTGVVVKDLYSRCSRRRPPRRRPPASPALPKPRSCL